MRPHKWDEPGVGGVCRAKSDYGGGSLRWWLRCDEGHWHDLFGSEVCWEQLTEVGMVLYP